ncbi:TonB-dependent receptor [Myroides odoratimimus]|uniref:TonB-dependent receptor n=1 Tax=Myroides odoratimimus TaxID=76832 RepID=UPI0025774D4F|nr:TonB-dependent receptor [Myroides odoratimimus]MDM1396309.1 TonB-dependent receptor [Myroides odoratimimus]
MGAKSILFISLLACATTYAQDLNTTREVTTPLDTISSSLEDIVIVANRKPTKISDIPGTVWVIQPQQIQQQYKNGVPLKEMLAILVPGLDIGSQGRSNYGQNMRGRSMLVMIDGVSLNSLRSISRQLDAIDPFNIAKIEVLSGASSIYGGNATGGIVNIITKQAQQHGWTGDSEISARSGLAGAKDRDLRIAQSINYKNDKLSTRISAALQDNGATYDANRDQIMADIAQTDLQYNRSLDLMATGTYSINDHHQITALVQYYNSNFQGETSAYLGDNLGAFTNADQSQIGMRKGFYTDHKPGTERFMTSVSYNGNNILGGQDLYIQVAHRSENLTFYPFPGTINLPNEKRTYMSASQQNTKYTGIKAVLTKDLNFLKFTYGVDFDFEKFEGKQNVFNHAKSLESGGLINKTDFTIPRYPTNNSFSVAGYAQAIYNITNQLQLSGGIRFQNINVKVDDIIGSVQNTQVHMGYGKSADIIPGGKSSYNMTTTNFGILYKPTTNQQIWATFSQGVSLADPAKYYGYGNYKLNEATQNWDLQSSLNVKDQPLNGLKTNQFELGYRFKTDNGFKGQISGFISQSDKNLAVDRKTFQVLLLDQKLRNMGIEAELSYTNNGFYIGTNTLIITSEVKQDDDWTKQDITTASPSKLVGYTGYTYNNWSFRLQSTQSLKLTDEANNTIKAYNTSDLMVGYRLPIGNLNLGIQNLFNTDYQSIWSKRSQTLYSVYNLPALFDYNGRGRTFTLTYSYSF